jgi:hypothetical protein
MHMLVFNKIAALRVACLKSLLALTVKVRLSSYRHGCRVYKTSGNRAGLASSRWYRSDPIPKPARFPPKTVPKILESR